MKWIGQHIWQLISRFRSDVYLEDIETGTIASGSNLGLDSNNKIVKNTVGGGGTTDLTSDVTGVLPIANGGTNANTAAAARTSLGVDAAGTDNSTNVTLAGSLDYITLSGQEITRNAIDLAADVTGTLPVANGGTGVTSLGSINISSLNNDSGFTSNTGDITAVKFTTDTGDANCIGSSGNITFEVLGGEGIDVTNADTTITVAGEDASDSNKGIVELATTSEADTGTDTARAVTPAGLKSHVDARYSYQYLHFSFKVNGCTSEAWHTPSQNGPEYYLWNNSHTTGGSPEPASHTPAASSVGSSTIEIDYLDQPSAFVIPKACKLDGFYGNCRTNNTTPNTARPVVGLFRAAEPSDSNNTDVTATCVAIDKYDTSTGNRKNRFLKLETSGLNTDLAQGDLLFPAVGLDEAMSNSNGLLWGSFTIVLKTLIP